MIQKVFTVYDVKAELYAAPQLYRTTGECIRAFQKAVNTADTQFNQYPSDFTLFEIGEYDDSNGRITMLETKIPLGLALEFLDKTPDLSKHNLSMAQGPQLQQ